jgi:hypothetical protein
MPKNEYFLNCSYLNNFYQIDASNSILKNQIYVSNSIQWNKSLCHKIGAKEHEND